MTCCLLFTLKYLCARHTHVDFGAAIKSFVQNIARADFWPCCHNILEVFSADFSRLEKTEGTHIHRRVCSLRLFQSSDSSDKILHLATMEIFTE
uniref:Uncharacterized protein n=1 Tax=Rhipicephalus zambeziensis TaxID=60191 RepID=A0A224Y697_9ACAR